LNMGARRKKYLQVALGTLESFSTNKMGFQCVALSYFCSMAAIPMLAIVFAVLGDLGLSHIVSEFLYRALPNNTELLNILLDKANNVIFDARSGIVGIISFIFFMWTIIWMFFQIERVFNNAWGLGKVPRKIYKRFSFYIIMLVILPFLILIFCAGILAYSNVLSFAGVYFKEWKIIKVILCWVGFFLITVLTLSAMYKFIPAAKVRYICALRSSLLTAFVFSAFQYVYLQTQIFMTRLNAIYGVIAAVPLFLMWLNFSWQIIMYGCELSYSLQKADESV